MQKLAFLIALFTTLPAIAHQSCDSHGPSPAFLKDLQLYGAVIEKGVVSQIGIDQKRFGTSRFEMQEQTPNIEIERLWGMGAKSIAPQISAHGLIKAIHFSFNLRSQTLYGMGLWSLQLTNSKGILADAFTETNKLQILVDGEPVHFSSEALFELPRQEGLAWRTLTVIFDEPLPLTSDLRVDLYARTLFLRPWSLKNLTSGTRIDGCAYFVLEPGKP